MSPENLPINRLYFNTLLYATRHIVDMRKRASFAQPIDQPFSDPILSGVKNAKGESVNSFLLSFPHPSLDSILSVHPDIRQELYVKGIEAAFTLFCYASISRITDKVNSQIAEKTLVFGEDLPEKVELEQTPSDLELRLESMRSEARQQGNISGDAMRAVWGGIDTVRQDRMFMYAMSVVAESYVAQERKITIGERAARQRRFSGRRHERIQDFVHAVRSKKASGDDLRRIQEAIQETTLSAIEFVLRRDNGEDSIPNSGSPTGDLSIFIKALDGLPADLQLFLAGLDAVGAS